MDVTSTELGTYTILFHDKALDHAFAQWLCEKLVEDPRVERASHYSDYDSDKIELVVYPADAASITPQRLVKRCVLHMMEDLDTLMHCSV